MEIKKEMFIEKTIDLFGTNPITGKKVVKGACNCDFQELIDLEEYEEIEKKYKIKVGIQYSSSYDAGITKYNFNWIQFEDEEYDYRLMVDGLNNDFTDWAKNKYRKEVK